MSLHYSVTRSILSGLIGISTGWEVRGRSHVPMDGGLIVASNHISYYDPPFVGTAAVRELHFLAKEELFRPPVFGSLIRAYNSIPIRRGAADVRGLTAAMEVLRAGHALILFPEGTRSRDGELQSAKPGVGMLAVNTGARILPCYIHGSDRSPWEWFTRRTRLRVSFGPARTWQELAGADAGLEPGRALYQCVGDSVMREIAALKAALMKDGCIGRGNAVPISR